MCLVEAHELWYSREEFASFRRDTIHQAQLVQDGERRLTVESTSMALHRSYNGFCNVQTSQDILVVLASTPRLALHCSLIGLDRLTVPNLAQDKLDRRQRMLRQVQWIQRNYVHDHTLRQDKIRRVCRSISQPSRLYAHHLAQLAVLGGN